MQRFLFYLNIYYCVMFGCYLLEACSFLFRDRNRVDRDESRGGEDLGGLEGRETI